MSSTPPYVPLGSSGIGLGNLGGATGIGSPAPPPQIRRTTVGFRADKALAPGEKRQIKTQMQRPFRAERLLIPDEFADGVVHSITVGTREQLMMGDIPAVMFTSTSMGTPLQQMDTASVAETIAIVVSRPNGGDFSAAMIGVTVDDWAPGDRMPPPVEPLIEEAALAVKEADEAYEPGVTLEELEAAGLIKP